MTDTAPKVSYDTIKALLARVNFTFTVEKTTTICIAWLDDKFRIGEGYAACVSPENYNQAIGESIARKNCLIAAENKLWELEGYKLYCDIRNIQEVVSLGAFG